MRTRTHSEKARISRIALREATARLFGDDVLQSGATTMCGGWGAISWDHGDLVNLFAALGCDVGVCRDHWPAGEFDAMARLTFSCTRPARFASRRRAGGAATTPSCPARHGAGRCS